ATSIGAPLGPFASCGETTWMNVAGGRRLKPSTTWPARMPVKADAGTVRSGSGLVPTPLGGRRPVSPGGRGGGGGSVSFLLKRLPPASPRHTAISPRQATARTGWPSRYAMVRSCAQESVEHFRSPGRRIPYHLPTCAEKLPFLTMTSSPFGYRILPANRPGVKTKCLTDPAGKDAGPGHMGIICKEGTEDSGWGSRRSSPLGACLPF